MQEHLVPCSSWQARNPLGKVHLFAVVHCTGEVSTINLHTSQHYKPLIRIQQSRGLGYTSKQGPRQFERKCDKSRQAHMFGRMTYCSHCYPRVRLPPERPGMRAATIGMLAQTTVLLESQVNKSVHIEQPHLPPIRRSCSTMGLHQSHHLKLMSYDHSFDQGFCRSNQMAAVQIRVVDAVHREKTPARSTQAAAATYMLSIQWLTCAVLTVQHSNIHLCSSAQLLSTDITRTLRHNQGRARPC